MILTVPIEVNKACLQILGVVLMFLLTLAVLGIYIPVTEITKPHSCVYF